LKRFCKFRVVNQLWCPHFQTIIQFRTRMACIQLLHSKYEQRKWHFAMTNEFSWGDFAVHTLTDLMEMVKERKERKERKETKEKKLTNAFELARQQYLEENPVPLCAGCNTFQIHPNPPADWAKSDYIYCCLHCRNTEGKGHGDRCKKCLPPKKIKNTSYCLDCEY
jgi:hypothetical protein